MKAKETIAFFLGSFDPPHSGHDTAVRALLEARGVGEVWIVPTGPRKMKKGVWVAPNKGTARKERHSPVRARVKLCKALVEGLGDARVKLFSEYSRQKHASTLKALEFAQALFPAKSFRLVTGSDLNPEAYSGGKELCERFPPLMVLRKGNPFPETPAIECVTPKNPSPASSSEIRERVARGSTIAGLVPEKVREVIEEEGLYLARARKPSRQKTRQV
ncbi:MAG TPA: hypothetical protein VJI67_01150 [archaeon]|nr:hypothetical protein [archaeon]